MVCYCLDLRQDTKMSRFLSKKIVSILIGLIQLGLWGAGLLSFIIQPPQLKERISNFSSGEIAVAIITILIFIAFSILLLLGLLRNNRTYLKLYQIFILVMTVLLILSVFVVLFTNPKRLGVGGFISNFIMIFLNLLTFFIVRNYYLSYIAKMDNANHNQGVRY